MEAREGTKPMAFQLQQAAAHQTQPVCIPASLHAKAAATRGQCDHMNFTQLLGCCTPWKLGHQTQV